MTIVEMAKNLAPEVKDKALQCKTVDELLSLAKENNIDLTKEKAEEILNAMGSKELSDSDLDSVAGGVCAADVCGGHACGGKLELK